MTPRLTVLAAWLVLAAAVFTSALAPAQAHPSYQFCGHKRCTPLHRAYRVECGGIVWISPRPVRLPRRARHNPAWLEWCAGMMPAF